MHTEATMSGNWMEGDYQRAELGNLLDKEDHITQMVREGKFRDLHKEYQKTGAELVTPDGSDNSLEYPLAEVIATFQSNYFTSTPAYMIPLALLTGAKKISLFGVDFDYADPRGAYEAGKPCVEYWIGRAQNGGVHVHLPAKTNLMSTMTMQKKGLYGYGYEQPQFRYRDGKLALAGFSKNPAPGTRRSVEAISTGRSGDHRDGADKFVLAAARICDDGTVAGSVDNQFGLSGASSKAELFVPHGRSDEGDSARHAERSEADARENQQHGPGETAAAHGLQQEAASVPVRNGHDASDLGWSQWDASVPVRGGR